tara:strand:+ start:1776 stop:2324 length:549 start_codon:yes stop_codon:yes gene_type:complete
MSYKLYTDKQENFECQIYLEGTSLSKAKARLIVESGDLNLMFNGKIDKNGKCQVPIKKLRGLLDENANGNIKLEVIAEDTYFQPWQSEFTVDTAKKIKVEIKEQKQSKKSNKPKMVVKEIKNHFDPVEKISIMLTENGMSVDKVLKNKTKVVKILKEYSDKIKFKKGSKIFIREVIKKLANN